MNTLGYFRKIFIGSGTADKEGTQGAYRQQAGYLKEIWNDKTYGIERVFRLFLCLIQFIYPAILLRSVLTRRGATVKKLSMEFYEIMKLLLPVLVLAFGLYRHNFIIILIIYLLTETIFHILNFIFLSDIYSFSVSYTRSILLLLLKYVEVILDFSAIYIGFDLLNETLPPVSAVYFSFVTATTLGYGDYYPKGGVGHIVAIFQLMIFIMFVLLFVNYFSQRANRR